MIGSVSVRRIAKPVYLEVSWTKSLKFMISSKCGDVMGRSSICGMEAGTQQKSVKIWVATTVAQMKEVPAN